MREIKSKEFGKLIVRQVPLPEGWDPNIASYTPSGRVAFRYSLEGDPENFCRLATVNDDGTDLRVLYEGELKLNSKANGFRYMPFADNRRVYIGDYILECEPDCDHAEKAEFIPIHYPEEITEDPGTWMIWSENTVAPDNEHIAWSTLGAAGAVYVAKLRREADRYELDNIRCVSNAETYPADPAHPGCVLESPGRGGEVKQFVRGGLGLSYVGVGRGMGNSMLQALDSEEVAALSLSPGYDETTILSPDEKLGLTMTSRFSPRTSCALIGLIPRRGNLNTKQRLAMPAYLCAVAGPRISRADGNVGPALVDLERAQTELDYLGVDLHDPEERWIYYSPMSWHPAGKKAMWCERLRRSLGDQGRISLVELCDYAPGQAVPAAGVPEDIPYATPGVRTQPEARPERIVIAGAYSGTAVSDSLPGEPPVYRTVYENFSDDGKTFYHGWESAAAPEVSSAGDCVYQADLTVTGEHRGEMKCRIVFQRPRWDSPVTVAEESTGYAEYDGKRLDVEDMK